MSRLRPRLLTLASLIALVLLAWLPFLQADLPRSADGRLHLYRIIALDDAWTRDGHLYPRYASNLVYGYGAPLFNYFPPVAYVPGALLHRLGLSYTQAFQVTMMGALLIAAIGMYALVSSTWPGEERYRAYAGLGGAALYVYSPYLLFDAVGRGSLTEVVALAVLPWVLWAMLRMSGYIGASHERTRQALSLQVWIFIGLLALFIPLHNVVTLHGGLLMIFVGLALLMQSPQRGRLFLIFLAAGMMAGLMSVFFLAPALLEGNAVKIRAVTEALSFIDVTRTLRPLSDLFALWYTADPTNLQPNTPIVTSWIALLLSVLALWSLRHTKTVRLLIIALTGLFLLTILLMWQTPLGVWLWHTIPLLDYTQFAWRIMGIGSLVLAWLGGWVGAILIAKLDVWSQGRMHPAPTMAWAVLLSAILLYGLPWTIARHESIAANNIIDIQAHERTSGELALSSYSEYLPTGVESPPEPNRLTAAFASHQPVARLRENTDIVVQRADWGGTSGSIAFQASQPTTLVFDWLYVPGWAAHFTNAEAQSLPLTVKSLSPHGLVSVEVPAGTYTLEIAWHETPLESLASLVSFIMWGVWLIAGIILVGARYIVPWSDRPLQTSIDGPGERATHGSPLHSDRDRLSERARYIVPLQTLIVSMAIVLFKIVIIDHQTDSLWYSERYANDSRPPLATFADQIFVREANLEKTTIRAGEDVPITLYWQVGQTPVRDESSLIELRDANGQVVASGGSFQPGGLAMTHWQPQTYVIENTSLSIPSDVPPGEYTLTLGLYDPVTKEARSVLNEAGNPQDVKTTLGTLTVDRPVQPFQPVSSMPITDAIAFAGVKTPLPQEAAPGQEFVFDPAWVMVSASKEMLQVRLMWTSEGHDQPLARSAPLPLVPTYPLDQWQVRDVWRGVQTVFVAGGLDTGDYGVSLELVNATGETGGQSIPLGQMHITAPERTYDLPDDLVQQKIGWANGLTLQGYTGTLSDFTLYWQTEQPIQANLRLSVQIVDDAGQIVAQQDGVPVDWTRPVAGWAMGEVIATHYAFNVSDGDYDVHLVWYAPEDGHRVRLIAGGDTAILKIDQ